ncbi:chaperonin-containing T-complex subunit [Saccharomycopsis crataegensis]|uniref:CCT-theta n=1 Tax=Saccharomycopsis crataegensis TaxID=43959 RepID=A0AAV5QGB9_9ASCO|nr:chaperonin-containing T-complex subunit [Saccharomycopsis crataegensis]
MSLKLPNAPNAGLFKQGYQTYSNADGAVNRNVEACKEIASMVLTSIGPCGRNKIIVNHLQKVFITNDAATMLKELDVVHPAVKLMVMASEQQEMEMGDQTSLVIILAGELLIQAQKLITLGLNPTEIIQGYNMANVHALEYLEKHLTVDKVDDFYDANSLQKIIKPVLASKQYGHEDVLSELVIEAIKYVLPRQQGNDGPESGVLKNFNVDSIRIVKILGSSIENSYVIKGMVFPREPEGQIKNITQKSKVAVFTCPIDISTTETKGTVLLHNAKEMLDFSKGEEEQLEQIVKEIYEAGIKVVIAGSSVGDLVLHYMNRYGILLLKVPSKFDLRRVCRVCGATPLPRLGAPLPEEAGVIDLVETKEIGGDRVTVFTQDSEATRTSTIVLRGATQNSLDDIERAIDDAVSSIKGLTKDTRLVPGAGSSEAELVDAVTKYGEKTPGLLQLAIKNFAEAFEVVPRTLADTAGLNSTEIIPRLYAAHTNNSKEGIFQGIDVDNENGTGLVDVRERQIYDLFVSKKSAINLATEAACTILSVDQIIMAKRAGGPVMPNQPRPGNWDQAD